MIWLALSLFVFLGIPQAREIRQWATPPMRQFLHRVESMDNILDAEEIDG